jgi:hypothetical protein
MMPNKVIMIDVGSGKLISGNPASDHPAVHLERITSGGEGRMVITLDGDTGEPISVTDENGTPAQRFNPTPDNPLNVGGVRVLGVSGHAILHIQHNPKCVWYTKPDGTLWQVCK